LAFDMTDALLNLLWMIKLSRIKLKGVKIKYIYNLRFDPHLLHHQSVFNPEIRDTGFFQRLHNLCELRGSIFTCKVVV
jgi:hypothetical protein